MHLSDFEANANDDTDDAVFRLTWMNFLSGEKREEFPHYVQQVEDTALKRHTLKVIIWSLIVKHSL